MTGSYKPSDALLSDTVWLNEIRKLQTDRQFRDARKCCYVEGVRNFMQLVRHDFEIIQLVYSQKLLTVPVARQHLRRLRREGVPTRAISPEQFRQISTSARASGIGAIFRQKWSRLHTLSPQADLCWVILEQVRSAGNLGTLIRTSEAVGGAGFILLGNQIDPYAPASIRATMGAFCQQQFIRTNLTSLRHWIRRHRCYTVGAALDGTTTLHQGTYHAPTLLLLGEERKGLTRQQRQLCQTLVRYPY